MKKKIEEKEELESAMQELSKKIKELADIQEEKEQEIERLSKMKERMTKTYKIFTTAQFQLEQYGIEMDDMDHVRKERCWNIKGKLQLYSSTGKNSRVMKI